MRAQNGLMQNNVTAEITITRVTSGFLSSLFIAGLPVVQTDSHKTSTEAVWRAVDAIRADDQRTGVVAIYHHDGHLVAHAPLWAVPAYDHLDWEPRAVPIDLATNPFTDEPTLVGRAP